MILNIDTIYEFIVTESGFFTQGTFCTVIKLAGCNLKCKNCNSKHLQNEKAGKEVSIDYIIREVLKYKTDKIIIKGGEPLIQREALQNLILQLKIENKKIQVETNGSFLPDLYGVDGYVINYKLPSSNMENKMCNFFDDLNTANDSIKFECMDKKDIGTAVKKIYEILQTNRILLSFLPKIIMTPVLNSDNTICSDIIHAIKINDLQKFVTFSLDIETFMKK